MVIYFRHEKARVERKRIAEATKGVGKPKVGGKFELVNQDGERFTDEDMKGRFALVGDIYIFITPSGSHCIRNADSC